ncbi:MAG TPA: serine/threonine-protein kinase [Kofleriaceae bacterium]
MAGISTAGVTIPRDDDTDGDGEERQRRPSAPLDPGPRYAERAVIGRGGLGEVVALDVQIGRDVAIKRLRDSEPSAAAQARFLREARIQGRLEHPSIPPVYELARDDNGQQYFAMRKLDGVTLAKTLRDPQSPFTRQRLLRAFIDICHAIDLAHSRRIIHRDLKPANILLGERGEVYVLDWGIARELDTPNAFAGPTQGTPGFMAPEQIRGDIDLDERVDIYALGCILFEILTRTPLHPRGKEAHANALRGDFPVVYDQPPELVAACRRATHVERERRFASVRELIAIVQGFLDGDRDLEHRRLLARQHLARATAALAEISDDETRRSIAMREAGQALALDPTLSDAAELIGRIMLEPPATLPPAVEREMVAIDWKSQKTLAHLSSGASLVFLSMIPIFLWLGIRDVPYMTAYIVLSCLMLGLSLAQARIETTKLMTVFAVTMICMFALIARMFTPLLTAPALASTYIATMPFSPLLRGPGRLALLTASSLAAIGGVWGAELIGWLSPTTKWENATLVLRSPLDGMEGFPALTMLAFSMVTLIGLGAVFSAYAMRDIRRARLQLVVQAWHLRQLAPTSVAQSDAGR